MLSLVELAAAFAEKAHGSQLRKYTHEPYTNHTKAVAALVHEWGGDDTTVAAAHLHDVLEDTPVTCEELVAVFGAEVAGLVLEVTDTYTKEAFPSLNRATRKRLERERLALVSPRAKLIKRADIEDNTKSIVERDPAFAKTYMPEKVALLKVL